MARTAMEIVRTPTGGLSCGKNGGSVQAAAGDTLQWSSDGPFTLEFFGEALESERPGDKRERWPFQEPAPKHHIAEATKSGSLWEFTGTVRKHARQRVYKYCVTLLETGIRLDPIIIVN